MADLPIRSTEPSSSSLSEGKSFPSVLTALRNRAAYQKAPKQVKELETEQDEEDDYGQEDQKSAGRESPRHADR